MGDDLGKSFVSSEQIRVKFMVPRYIDFLTELPKTPTFKIRKVPLRDMPITETTFDREATS